MGVLIQPRGVSGRFVVLTHPRTGVPVYALPSGGEMWVLEQLGAGGRSWFLGGRDEVACGALSMLVKADAMFFLLRTVPTRLFLPLDDISDLPAPLALPALARCCDSQLADGTTTFRLSTARLFAALDAKLTRLASADTFAKAPNTLGRAYDRLVEPGSEDATRRLIAAHTVAEYLPPHLADEWASHLGMQPLTQNM